uniref:TrbC family F-type conjugative pilus assembly protein n=1 Tax=Mucispirillum schaedleri TaxID=248039 RepID=UPI001F56F232
GVTGLLIDPVLFKTYSVTNVPQVVYAKEVNRRVDLGSEGDFSRLETTPQWWKSVGDWSLEYHLRELYNLSKEEKLKQIYK